MLLDKSIVLLPASNETTASSRIRIFSLAKELKIAGHPFTFDMAEHSKAVIIQKRVTEEIIAYARRSRRRGSVIVYDVDDLGHALDHWVPRDLFVRMLRIADVVVTATYEQGQLIRENHNVKHVEVVSNCIDYYPTYSVRPKIKSNDPLRILWFGNAQNLSLLGKYATDLLTVPDTEIVVCTDLKAGNIFTQNWPMIKLSPWNLSTFIETLQSCHLTCLMHDGTEVDRAKANNRMITSVAWGVPAIVSNTPSYVRTAQEMGMEDIVFEDIQGLLKNIERFRDPLEREHYLEIAQDSIWNRYSPKAIMTEYLTVINSAVERIHGFRRLLRWW